MMMGGRSDSEGLTMLDFEPRARLHACPSSIVSFDALPYLSYLVPYLFTASIIPDSSLFIPL
jgi:hypothetical protein